jgi:organic hydroperoxide reductase OsmC/OhrA
MRISARITNSGDSNEVSVSTAELSKTLHVAAKPDGRGSSVNGGEFLMLALATCFCNDLYREAERLNVRIDAVTVEAAADFDGVGLAASNVRYRASIDSPAARHELDRLLRHTDAVAEVQNTVRAAVNVLLVPWEGDL